eukprot:5478426-Amphidinium_carterae.1
MSAVVLFDVQENSFEGALPASGLQGLRAVFVLYVSKNRFAGTLPSEGFGALAGLDVLAVMRNEFEGEMSEAQYGHRVVVLCFFVGLLRDSLSPRSRG